MFPSLTWLSPMEQKGGSSEERWSHQPQAMDPEREELEVQRRHERASVSHKGHGAAYW